MEMAFQYALPPPPDESSEDCVMPGGADDLDIFMDEGNLAQDPFILSEDSISISSTDIDIGILEKVSYLWRYEKNQKVLSNILRQKKCKL